MAPYRCAVIAAGGDASFAAEARQILGHEAAIARIDVAHRVESCAMADLVLVCAESAADPELASLIARLSAQRAHRPLLAATRRADPESLAGLLHLGAGDFVRHPFDAAELLTRVRRALGLAPGDLRATNASWLGTSQAVLASRHPRFNRDLARLPALASGDAGVLICGEPGSGRSTLLHAMLRLAPSGARIELASAAADASCIDAALGSLREAFEQVGKQADDPGQTPVLLLREADALDSAQQARIAAGVAALVPPAGARPVRIVGTAGVDGLHGPLAHRLSLHRIDVPPLRERREDIVPLAGAILSERCGELQRPLAALSPSAARRLLAHDWPGNARELRAVLHGALQGSYDPVLGAGDLPVDDGGQWCWEESLNDTKKSLVESFERAVIEQLLAASNGNIAHAARAVQKDRRAMFELIRKYGIEVERFKPGCQLGPA